ncbi:sulfite exporter TauE/SafE family protein [Rossellomorea aquimaris]|uniref:Cytochrome c biogenesis protein CcdA n=1 Tax=Rossellomorea aquimaris TaxID=189382 RepID=A0A366ESI1_9BACI|nr:sulfite exporter TauE/SafE family protein [Rossellomorea aquimaris]RBP05348.1 cytochrome c biogenesis protein CcdA [Rossellomorea aquimaris]
MYEFFSRISNVLSEPFINLTYGTEGVPIFFAFILGIVGALAPCQFTGNIGAITLYGNKSLQKGLAWSEVVFFTLGKILTFTAIGLLAWSLGNEFQQEITEFFPWMRKVIGPVLLLSGLFMLGIIKLRGTLTLLKIPSDFIKEGKLGSFLMGVSFSLGFCPTMFVLFFVSLMPVVVSTSYGFALPSIFAIGTTLPLFIAIFLIWYFEAGGTVMEKGRKIGFVIQRAAGVIMILLGVVDTLTYWTI